MALSKGMLINYLFVQVSHWNTLIDSLINDEILAILIIVWKFSNNVAVEKTNVYIENNQLQNDSKK